MIRIGITGHMNLTDETVPLVAEAIRNELAPVPAETLIGFSCLARGADSIFAEVTLDHGGRLEVVLPARNYRETKVKPDHAQRFDNLLDRASAVHTMPFENANRDAYQAANDMLLDTCDKLIAVWDGEPGADKGSTSGLVEHARLRGLPVVVIWPEGAARTQ